ncbi:hypothetical protein FOA52_014941 [Chlamydomonas sp. UWO 241]|nr:hypothetical protein FOA52_014941 [Chlamydomonas sp. UWO 241]
MSLQAMPLVLVNLGCQMMYILDQRLKAQEIALDKACRVLQDVVYTMLDPSFIEKMFLPQDLYSLTSTRKIFERLVHSSIMRLSESSMDKLFDLMVMGVKYQLHCASRLEQIMEVTNLHLDTLKSMLCVLSDAGINKLIEDARTRMKQVSMKQVSMSMGQLHLLRQTLQRYFLDKRVKVSLFLLEGIQSSSGRLILSSPNGPNVGCVTYFDGSGAVTGSERVKMKSQEVAAIEFFVHPEPLGTNLYDKTRGKVEPPERSFDLQPKPSASKAGGFGGEPAPLALGSSSGAPVAAVAGSSAYAESASGTFAEEVLQKGGRGQRHELDLLAALMAVPARAKTSDNFKLSLFGDDDMPLGAAGGSGGAGPKVVVDANSYKRTLAGAMGDMSVGKDGGDGDNDDLLDLMDGL